MFTHRMKESLGLAEKTTSNEQVRDLSKRLDMLAEHLKMIIKGVQKTTAGLRGTFLSMSSHNSAPPLNLLHANRRTLGIQISLKLVSS